MLLLKKGDKLHIWFLAFTLNVNLVLDISNVSIWSIIFWYCVKRVPAIKC